MTKQECLDYIFGAAGMPANMDTIPLNPFYKLKGLYLLSNEGGEWAVSEDMRIVFGEIGKIELKHAFIVVVGGTRCPGECRHKEEKP